MLTCGCIGALVGRVLAPIVNVPDLDWRFGFLAAFDGLGIVSLVHVLRFQDAGKQDAVKPLAIFSMFVLVGMKWGKGNGLGWQSLAGVANGIVASSLALAVLGLLRRGS